MVTVTPQSSTTSGTTIPCAPDSEFVFDIPMSDAMLSRDGNNLVLTFEDGNNLVLADFYTVFTKDTMPNFVVNGAQVAGADLFAALNQEDLMPADGPAAGGGHYNDYRLFGDAGDDILDGGAGDDRLFGDAGADHIYGGDGNDIIIYDSQDFLVDGDEGLGMLVGSGAVTAAGNENISGVEVFIDPKDMSLTNMADLADKLGVHINDDKTVTFDAAEWTLENATDATGGYVSLIHTNGATALVQRDAYEENSTVQSAMELAKS